MPASPNKRPPLIVAVVALVIAAVVVLCFVRLPRPLRLAVAGVDLVAAAALFAVSRQQGRR